MIYGNLSDLEQPIARLVQGTAMIDGRDEAKDFALLDAALELGYSTFDTAHVYGKGANERAFGRWLAARGVRERVMIIAKGAHHSEDRKRVTPFDISADLHDSLARLGVEHIDLYLLHRDDPEVAVAPIIDILNEHLTAGRIKAFGASNWTTDRIEAANRYAEAAGLRPITASSPQLSLAEQIEPPWEGCVSISGEAGRAARAYYQKTGMALLCWSSLAGGFMTGRFRRDNLAAFEGELERLTVGSYANEANFQRLDRAKVLAETKDCSLPQLALAYVLNQPLNTFALVGSSTPEELADNLQATALELGEDEIAWLERGDDTP